MPLRPHSTYARVRFAWLAVPAVAAALAIVPARAETPAAAGKVVILSTSDVKAKTVPCGCHVPKGGLSRRAAFADSLRKLDPNLLVVDAGGYFPTIPFEIDDAPFIAQAMLDLRLDAVGLGDRELQFGLGYYQAIQRDAPLPVTCANVWERSPHRLLAKPWFVKQAGRYKVGFFGLATPDGEYGKAADSIEVSDPTEAARGAVAALRKEGADVVVLLSTLGKAPTEDLALAVPGIDVAVAAHDVPLLQRSRQLDQTTVVYGGEQGQYVGLTTLGLDDRGAIVTRESGAWMLGPAVRDQAAMLAKVSAYEARPEVKARRPRTPEGASRDSTKTSLR